MRTLLFLIPCLLLVGCDEDQKPKDVAAVAGDTKPRFSFSWRQAIDDRVDTSECSTLGVITDNNTDRQYLVLQTHDGAVAVTPLLAAEASKVGRAVSYGDKSPAVGAGSNAVITYGDSEK